MDVKRMVAKQKKSSYVRQVAMRRSVTSLLMDFVVLTSSGYIALQERSEVAENYPDAKAYKRATKRWTTAISTMGISNSKPGTTDYVEVLRSGTSIVWKDHSLCTHYESVVVDEMNHNCPNGSARYGYRDVKEFSK